jgi:hypothetical protein
MVLVQNTGVTMSDHKPPNDDDNVCGLWGSTVLDKQLGNNKVYRHADECLSQGKRREIQDPKDN